MYIYIMQEEELVIKGTQNINTLNKAIKKYKNKIVRVYPTTSLYCR
jgi:hypothetical protein